MELLHLFQPFRHRRSPKPVLRLALPKHFAKQLVVLLKRKVQVLLHRYHEIPVYPVPRNQLNVAVEGVVEGVQVLLGGGEPYVADSVDGDKEVMEGAFLAEKVVHVIEGDFEGGEAEGPDFDVEDFVFVALEEDFG